MMDDIVRKLRAARKAKGLTQGALGAKMGLPQSHISQIEAGKVDMRLSSFLEMARFLDLEPVLVPRALTPAVRSLLSGDKGAPQPAWRPDDMPDDMDVEDEKEELP
ncbi:helix-turn-helix transcriptional regulator [Desulfurivibrio alkaliphilus]|uniref:Transcriptional regulator, XRE family n=1 Tax=Desulfurivibrio alkaliphilus (strain DSM 19089 / UNIQEM U267 / AHT2) TaxID=589865 RepID=D6Z0Y9_DESAT|nr:helix-turn-helix transcriptional regulator [Desulfurivibrio alkaliphilus]ADH87249.1 transcriptional regulator, XRE family [Desulfurivibrio alkaliphilus AHT 2]